ncbi:MAG: sugar ABC transporter substrate-binding protein, partial [Planctomycetaceae bacterium]|nr:sugar ABC transporter substrate-binding protein [Planctomycetaceae bacterium]
MVTKYLRSFQFGVLAVILTVSSLSQAIALDTAPLKGKSLAFVIQDLSNPVWAQYAKTLKEVGESYGMRVTAMDCKSNAATQITQVENFIQEGTDAIILHPAEANALETVAKQAKEAGMKVISWDILMENADVGYLKDNIVAGKLVGEQAAKWINEKLGGEAEVALLEYPVYPELIQRATGIEAGLKEFAPNAKIVARASAINATEGMSKTETLLLANPD